MLFQNNFISLCKQKRKNMRAQKLALLICQYNGQKGTQKQVEKCLKQFQSCESLMEQFCKGRIIINF